jgi:threonine dehydrogenase-like Zn-dependent dehydrogenase
MRGAILYGPRDLHFEEREGPTIIRATDAIIRISATCVCGSDLWPYRGIQKIARPIPMGHEYCGIVEEVGSSVGTVKPGQFVIGSFFASENTCPDCHAGTGNNCFSSHVHLHGGPAPVRRDLPELIKLVLEKKINPGKVFDLVLPLDQVSAVTARWTNGAPSRHYCAHHAVGVSS